ncbi:MAG TPA: alpha/beta hydrolase [Allosphingosinicella sp.]|nr:alpha/beta hydrolase [Allosphingosinicella sp.]
MRRNTLFAVASILGSATGGAALYGIYRRDIARIRAAVEVGGTRIGTDCGPIEYAREGSGPPVLVIHGAGGGYDQGLMLGREMFGSGFDVIAPSRFGYLATPAPADSSPSAQADAHAALLDQLRIFGAITVVGVSAGAPSAIELALRHPERVSALILAVPRAYAPGVPEVSAPVESRTMLRMVMAGADFAFWAASRFARRSVVRFLGVPPKVEAKAAQMDRERVTQVIRGILPLSKRIAGLEADASAQIRGWPLERIKVPTLVISAMDDLYGTMPAAAYTAEQIPDAELMVLPSGGHLMVGRGEEVRERIGTFLRNHQQAAAA